MRSLGLRASCRSVRHPSIAGYVAPGVVLERRVRIGGDRLVAGCRHATFQVPRASAFEGGECSPEPPRHVLGHVGVQPIRVDEGPFAQFAGRERELLRHLAVEQATVEHQHQALGLRVPGWEPIDDQQTTDRERNAQLLSDLTANSRRWRLVGLNGAAGNEPPCCLDRRAPELVRGRADLPDAGDRTLQLRRCPVPAAVGPSEAGCRAERRDRRRPRLALQRVRRPQGLAGPPPRGDRRRAAIELGG